MTKRCKESHAGWGHPHSNGLTQQRARQLAEAASMSHYEPRSFMPGRRCIALKGITLSAELRLTLTQNLAVHCGKIIESGR